MAGATTLIHSTNDEHYMKEKIVKAYNLLLICVENVFYKKFTKGGETVDWQ